MGSASATLTSRPSSRLRLVTDASLIPHLSYTTALQMADDGCPLVQRSAIAEAASAGLPLIIRSLSSEGTRVHQES